MSVVARYRVGRRRRRHWSLPILPRFEELKDYEGVRESGSARKFRFQQCHPRVGLHILTWQLAESVSSRAFSAGWVQAGSRLAFQRPRPLLFKTKASVTIFWSSTTVFEQGLHLNFS